MVIYFWRKGVYCSVNLVRAVWLLIASLGFMYWIYVLRKLDLLCLWSSFWLFTFIIFQDSNAFITKTFLTKLYKLLTEHMIPSRYACAFSFSLSSPCRDLHDDVTSHAPHSKKEIFRLFQPFRFSENFLVFLFSRLDTSMDSSTRLQENLGHVGI